MASIELKKLLLQGENIKAIDEIVKALNIKIIIKDEKETIYGNEDSSMLDKKFEINFDGEIIGFVIGEDKASCIVSIINSFAANYKELKKYEEQAADRYKELKMIYSISDKISLSAGINNIAKNIINEAMSYAESSYAAIMLLDEETGNLNIISEYNKNIAADLGRVHKFFKEDNVVVKNVLNKKQGQIINNIKGVSEIKEDNCDLKAFMVSPIIVKNNIIGEIIVGSHGDFEYKLSDLELCNNLASHAGPFIEAVKLYDFLRDNFNDTIIILSKIIEMKDSYTTGHYKRIINYSLNIARNIGMSKKDQVKLKLTVLLHDIGILSIKDELLNKKGRFTENEYDSIKIHPEVGAELLRNIEQLKDITPSIRSHHEKYDGTGYPDGLKGEEIPLFARIIAVADAFDAMTNNRPYKASMNMYFAAEELQKNKGKQFDPKIVDAFFEIYKDKKLEEIQDFVIEA